MEAIQAGSRADQRPLVEGGVFHRARVECCTEPAFIQTKWPFHCKAVTVGLAGINMLPLWLTDMLVTSTVSLKTNKDLFSLLDYITITNNII